MGGQGLHLVITGQRLKSPLAYPLLLFHATRSFAQAQRDPACRHVEAWTAEGIRHTATLWDSPRAAADYGRSGAHRSAAAIFPRIAEGKVWAGPAQGVPSRREAERLWLEQGRVVGGAKRGDPSPADVEAR